MAEPLPVSLPDDGCELILHNNMLTKEQSIVQLITYMKISRYTLDLCMMAIQDRMIVRCLLELHKRAVKIRVILNFQYRKKQEYYARILRRAGINVRWNKEPMEIPRKMCLVDSRPDERRRRFHSQTIVSIVTPGIEDEGRIINNIRDAVIYSSHNAVMACQAEFEQLWEEIGDDY